MHVRRLLLIDDDPEFRDLLNDRLVPHGFEVVQPPDPDNPLGHLKEVRPSIIVIAVELPDKVGYALCNKAKKGLARNIPVILTTRSVPASGFRSHRNLKVHADDYIDKRAMTEEEVVAKVDRLVGTTVGQGRSFSSLIGHSGGALSDFESSDVDFDELEELDMSELVEDPSLGRAVLPAAEGSDMATVDERASGRARQVADDVPEFDPRELGADADDDGSFEFGEPMRLGKEMVPVSEYHQQERSAASAPPAAAPTEVEADIAAELPEIDEFEPDGTSVASASVFPRLHDAQRGRASTAPYAASGAQRGSPFAVADAQLGSPVAVAGGQRGFPATTDGQRGSPLAAPDAQRGSPLAAPDAQRGSGAVPRAIPRGLVSGAGASASNTERIAELAPAAQVESSASVTELDLGLDQVASLAEEERSDVREFRRHQQRVAELEKEVERLRTELEEARRAPATGGSPFSREREFLNLREVINKKEKLILDLNDQIDGKDRQVLAEKEQVRELERVRSDLDAKILELEQNLLGVSEDLAELRNERRSLTEQLRHQTDSLASLRADAAELSRLLERERAQWREERESLQRKHAAALDNQKQQLEAARAAAEEALREKYGADLRTLKEAYEETTAEKDKSFGAALALAEVRRQEELTAAQRAAEERLQHELNEQRRRHQEELEALTREQATELETLVRQNQEARQALEDRHNADVARLEEEQSQLLAAADRRRASEVSDADKRRVMELAELEERRRRDLAAAGEERAQAEAELEEKFEGAQNAIQREHAEEKQQLEARRAALEQELGERLTELAQVRESLRAREEFIVSLHKMMAERDERLAGQRQELEELERQNAGYQEQILRAFQKIKADEEVVARAKKAMAIALTLLDDAEQASPPPRGKG